MAVSENVRKIALFVGSTLLSVLFASILLEFVFRGLSPLSHIRTIIPLRPNLVLQLRPELRGGSPSGMHTTNSLGLRGDEPPRRAASCAIIAIGGSTTHCFYLDDKKTWPYRLQLLLQRSQYAADGAACPRIWVGNGGIDGQTTRSHLHFMNEVIPVLKPQSVILLTGLNDLGLSIDKRRFEEGSYCDTVGRRWNHWLYQRSRLIQVLWTWKQVLIDGAHVVRSEHKTCQSRPLSGEAMKFPADPVVLLPQLTEYESNIRRIIASGRRQGIKMLFLTQPLLYEDTKKWERISAGYYWIKDPRFNLSAAQLSRLLEIYNHRLAAVCRSEGAACFDLASAIPHSEQYFYDSCHLMAAQKLTLRFLCTTSDSFGFEGSGA